MPMGLTNAPATCQRLMEMVLCGLPWKTCLVYLDDVLIYSRSFSEHLQHLEEILSRFQSSGLKLNPSKCCFARDQVQFLGHVVSKDGIQPDPRNVKSVQDWPIPRSATEVRAFLGLCSYYGNARWALELDPFEWTVIYKEGHSHLNADAMSRRTADIRPTEQSTFSSGPGYPPSDKRHSCPSLSSPISSVHHSLCSTDTKPVCCYLTGPQPPPASSRCVTQSVFSTFVLQLPEDDFKKEQQQDSILPEVISWKVKGQKQSR